MLVGKGVDTTENEDLFPIQGNATKGWPLFQEDMLGIKICV